MPYEFRNLDARTRRLMLQEVERDIAAGVLYLSPRLSEQGQGDYPNLLKGAIREGNDTTLAAALRDWNCLNTEEERQKADGTVSTVKVPSTAADAIAEDEFNRFYMRALCVRALEDGLENLTVYRAKAVNSPRAASQARRGTDIAPEALLTDLRAHIAVDVSLGLPAGRNTGLSLEIPAAP